MSPRALFPTRASTLLVTLSTLAAISLMAAYMLVKVMPRIRMAYQNAAWQEARIAAEAGIDAAMGDLLRNATAFSAGTWEGWQQAPAAAPAPGPGGAATAGPPGLLNQLGDTPTTLIDNDDDDQDGLSDTAVARIDKLLQKIAKHAAKKKNAATEPPATVAQTTPIFLDNLRISTQGGVSGEVDVQLWGLDAPALPHSRWFRIRSMGTCALPPVALTAPSHLEAKFRRFSLRAMRPTLRRDDVGQPSTVPLPSVSRIVEVLVEPITPFELAVWTGEPIRLAAAGAWSVDSFDSTDPAKSAAGLYPGRGHPAVQANGHIATGSARPFDDLYGPSIAANGAVVRGAIATNGGDDPATVDRENVSGAMRLDPARIRADFTRAMPPVARPNLPLALPAPALGQPYIAGVPGAPAVYSITGDLTDPVIKAPADPATIGELVLLIDGNLRVTTPLVLPPNVVALVFVKGHLFLDSSVNSGPDSSNRAAQLLIFADGPARQTLKATGLHTVTAAFYGPNTEVTLDGTVSFIGALSCARLEIFGSGDGGIHYDRALASVGLPIGFRIVRFIEDVRQ